MGKFKKSTSLIISLALTLSVYFLTTEKVHAQETTTNSQKKVIVVLKDKTSTKDKSSKLKEKRKDVKLILTL